MISASCHPTSILRAIADGTGSGPVMLQPPPSTYSLPSDAWEASHNIIVTLTEREGTGSVGPVVPGMVSRPAGRCGPVTWPNGAAGPAGRRLPETAGHRARPAGYRTRVDVRGRRRRRR